MNFVNKLIIYSLAVLIFFSCNSNPPPVSQNYNHNEIDNKISFFKRLMEGSGDKNSQFKKLVSLLEANREVSFLGFDGRWGDCNHDNHNYKEFFTYGNRRIILDLTLHDTLISYSLDYLERDIREVWGTETIKKEIKSEGTLEIKLLNNLNDFKFRLNDPEIKELMYISIATIPEALNLQLDFDCKTCSGKTLNYLYLRNEFTNVLVGDRLYLWKGYY